MAAAPLQVPNTEGLVLEGDKKAKKNLDIVLHGVWGRDVRSPLQPEVYTPARVPACSTPVLKALAGKAGKARRKLAELKLEQQAEGEQLSCAEEADGVCHAPPFVHFTLLRRAALRCDADLSMLRGLGEDGSGGEGSEDECGAGEEGFEGFEAEATSEDDSGPAWPTDNGEIQRLQAELQVRCGCVGLEGMRACSM